MSHFELHSQLAQDTHFIGDLTLCRVLLMDDENYPWLILVPRRDAVREIFELSEQDQIQLQRESSDVAQKMALHFNADKMNIAALGNVVPQLHIHHIVRFKTDPAWPAPVWGKVMRAPYAREDAERRCAQIRALLNFVA